mmetsp:Transcript_37856/g.80447  ORF Transcript_37856/g.80447 Transcript_37856/m.80447 type:complete len:135 (-) Transcript_37856:98-502(-)
MGAATCKDGACCAASSGNEIKLEQNPLAALTTDESPERKSISAVSDELKAIEGTWIRENDKMPMGDIRNNQVHWHPGYQHEPSKISVDDGNLEMELAGESHHGQIVRNSSGQINQLTWDDGEVWIRVSRITQQN